MAHATIEKVTDRIITRSKQSRAAYLARMQDSAANRKPRTRMSCSNFAHGIAACASHEKSLLKGDVAKNIAVVSAYNDMLSAHQPYARFPDIIKQAAAAHGAVAQFAGGVPAMCDGVTQGEAGMELSLFSRDVIALATTIALSHEMFDAAMCLGICDKIVPGLLMGSLAFGHLPTVFVPSGPMPSGISNKEKAAVRERYVAGQATRDDLLAVEEQSYHSAGTCTFYGTANTNQMMVEIMGLQLPGSSFVNPTDAMRDAFTRKATEVALAAPVLYEVVTEQSIVNAMVGLCATGGSTNHTIHIMAIARAAGILINWDDLSEISSVVPLICRIYPNGEADVNHFQAAGGMPVLIAQLLEQKLLHADVKTILGNGLEAYTHAPVLKGDSIEWHSTKATSADTKVLAHAGTPFQPEGGVVLLTGNLGRAVMKTSALKPENRCVEAPARIFTSQEEFLAAYNQGKLAGDFVAVVTYQGPAANGMPELHKLMPPLAVMQNLGQKVALVTDGRLSGASGKVPAAIHVSPEAFRGGALAKLREGDVVLVDGIKGLLEAKVDATTWAKRDPIPTPVINNTGVGRELFSHARAVVSPAEEGASFILGAVHE